MGDAELDPELKRVMQEYDINPSDPLAVRPPDALSPLIQKETPPLPPPIATEVNPSIRNRRTVTITVPVDDDNDESTKPLAIRRLSSDISRYPAWVDRFIYCSLVPVLNNVLGAIRPSWIEPACRVKSMGLNRTIVLPVWYDWTSWFLWRLFFISIIFAVTLQSYLWYDYRVNVPTMFDAAPKPLIFASHSDFDHYYQTYINYMPSSSDSAAYAFLLGKSSAATTVNNMLAPGAQAPERGFIDENKDGIDDRRAAALSNKEIDDALDGFEFKKMVNDHEQGLPVIIPPISINSNHLCGYQVVQYDPIYKRMSPRRICLDALRNSLDTTYNKMLHMKMLQNIYTTEEQQASFANDRVKKAEQAAYYLKEGAKLRAKAAGTYNPICIHNHHVGIATPFVYFGHEGENATIAFGLTILPFKVGEDDRAAAGRFATARPVLNANDATTEVNLDSLTNHMFKEANLDPKLYYPHNGVKVRYFAIPSDEKLNEFYTPRFGEIARAWKRASEVTDKLWVDSSDEARRTGGIGSSIIAWLASKYEELFKWRYGNSFKYSPHLETLLKMRGLIAQARRMQREAYYQSRPFEMPKELKDIQMTSLDNKYRSYQNAPGLEEREEIIGPDFAACIVESVRFQIAFETRRNNNLKSIITKQSLPPNELMKIQLEFTSK